jgi:hypothetical protein
MKGIYLTQEGIQEIEAKIARLEECAHNESDIDGIHFSSADAFGIGEISGEILTLKEILSYSTILPIEDEKTHEEKWFERFKCDYDTTKKSYLEQFYPNGVIILPTPNPSRLQLEMDGTYHIENGQSIALRSYQNIYIISDEKTKEKDWCLHQVQHEYHLTQAFVDNALLHYKIILTTDPKLIKDGIQPISDEFLEWFVKNPSCEEVKVENEKYILQHLFKAQEYKFRYKIIIPKEEPNPTTQVVREAMRIVSKEVRPPKVVREGLVKEELNLNCFDCNKSLQDCTCMEDTIDMKQETLEEAAERIAYNSTEENKGFPSIKIFIEGAKWQQERMYSEEEVKDILIKYQHYLTVDDDIDADEWFKQFKKK